MTISEAPEEMLEKTAKREDDDFYDIPPETGSRGWNCPRRERQICARRSRSSHRPAEVRERPKRTRSSGSQTPEPPKTPTRQSNAQTTRTRGRQMVSSERIESRRARTQDGGSQTRGRPLVNQRMRTESILSPRPERRESETQEPDELDLPRPSAPPGRNRLRVSHRADSTRRVAPPWPLVRARIWSRVRVTLTLTLTLLTRT